MFYFTNSVCFLLLPNMMAFFQNFILKPIKYSVRQCLKKQPAGEKIGNLNDFVLKVVLNQVYIPFLGWRCLMNPDDKQLQEVHWDLKVMFVSYGSSNIPKCINLFIKRVYFV